MMLTFLLMNMMAFESPLPSALEIPAYLFRPRVTFEDLDDDGLLDAWATDRENQLWVWFASSDAPIFRQLITPEDGLRPSPRMVEGVWRATFYENGALFAGFEDGWRAVTDDNNIGRARPGMQPIDLGERRLLPVFKGYLLMEGDCLVAELPAAPAVTLSERRLRLSYPVPEESDIDGDGDLDLISGPVVFGQRQEIGLWTALQQEDGWQASWQRLQFPPNLAIARYQLGDLNGDGWDDLVILTRPSQEMSLFDEMQFVVYLGNGLRSWDRQPVQVLKTKQNLWQEGPIEVDQRGVTFYYYKGLFKAKFKIDVFRWNRDGYIEPKPSSEKWTVDDGETSVVNKRLDLNGDGANDLILASDEQLWWYPRRDALLPYREDDAKILWQPSGQSENLRLQGKTGEVEIEVPPRGISLSSRVNRLSRYGVGFVQPPNAPMELWSLFQADSGYWYLAKRQDFQTSGR